MLISLIVAMDRNHIIGAGGELPWRLPADLKFFKSVTLDKPVVMGRKTYESIGKPLVRRKNIVLTSKPDYEAPGCIVVHSPDEALAMASDAPEVMVIGGAQIYREFLPRAQRIYLTCIDATFKGDVTFPELSFEAWQIVWEQAHSPDERNHYPFRFLILERRRADSDN